MNPVRKHPWGSVSQVSPSFGYCVPLDGSGGDCMADKMSDLRRQRYVSHLFTIIPSLCSPNTVTDPKYLHDKLWNAFQPENRLRGEFHVLFCCYESDGVRRPKAYFYQ